MSELRWHPLLRQWVGVAAHRQDRPQMPEDWCPFCPGSGHVPDDYDVYLYPNDFPAFSKDSPPFSSDTSAGLYITTGAQGATDVVLYSPCHNLLPSQLTVDQWSKVIGLWTRRTRELFADPVIQYVAVFENTGVAIGVTMPHPHGQIYAMPFVPPLVQTAVDSASSWHREKHRCLFCDILAHETRETVRIVASNDSFVAFLPFFGRFPTELSIYARRHFPNLAGMDSREAQDLASILSTVRKKYDNLFGFPMPLMMMVRQSPAKGDHPYFHFHIDFLPIQRSAKKIKYLAGIESGCGTFLNDTRAELQAEKMRAAEPRTTAEPPPAS